MITLTTPTGNIGSKVLAGLTSSAEKLRVLVRNPGKLSSVVRRRVEVTEGSLDDADAVNSALRGAEQLFFVIPPDNQYENADEYYLKFSNVVCAAIKKERVKRVVFVSGTGLGFEKNAGPVFSSFLVEEELKKTGVALRILHCGTFMENLFHAVTPIKMKSQFGTTVPAEVKIPWVATQDIAAVAIRLLLDKSWADQDSLGILGPKDLSYGDIAKVISEVLNKTVAYNPVPAAQFKATLRQFGSSEAAAQGLIDIYSTMKNGAFNRVERSAHTSSPTEFRNWCETVFKPLLR